MKETWKDRINCCPDCRQKVQALLAERAEGPDQSWVAGWPSDDAWRRSGANGVHEQGTEWMRSRPVRIKDQMRLFPPTCVVKAKPGHEDDCPIPMEGCVGIVVGFEAGDAPDTLLVTHSLKSPNAAQVPMEHLEVVGYRGGLRPEDVARILSDA